MAAVLPSGTVVTAVDTGRFSGEDDVLLVTFHYADGPTHTYPLLSCPHAHSLDPSGEWIAAVSAAGTTAADDGTVFSAWATKADYDTTEADDDMVVCFRLRDDAPPEVWFRSSAKSCDKPWLRRVSVRGGVVAEWVVDAESECRLHYRGGDHGVPDAWCGVCHRVAVPSELDFGHFTVSKVALARERDVVAMIVRTPQWLGMAVVVDSRTGRLLASAMIAEEHTRWTFDVDRWPLVFTARDTVLAGINDADQDVTGRGVSNLFVVGPQGVAPVDFDDRDRLRGCFVSFSLADVDHIEPLGASGDVCVVTFGPGPDDDDLPQFFQFSQSGFRSRRRAIYARWIHAMRFQDPAIFVWSAVVSPTGQASLRCCWRPTSIRDVIIELTETDHVAVICRSSRAAEQDLPARMLTLALCNQRLQHRTPWTRVVPPTELLRVIFDYFPDVWIP